VLPYGVINNNIRPSDILILAVVVFNPGDLYYLGYKKIIVIIIIIIIIII